MNKKQIIVVTILIATAYAFGRFAAPTKVVTETKIVEVEKKQTEIDKQKDKKKKTTIVVVKKPDGTTNTTTTIDEDTKTKTDTSVNEATTKTSDTVKEVVRDKNTLSVYGIAALDDSKVSYGAGVQKSILGPINIGIFGLSSGTGGCTLGLSF